MGELIQRGVEHVAKGQKVVTRHFPRAFKETPDLKLITKGGVTTNEIRWERLNRRGFRVKVNAIPLLEQDHTLEWEATGEVQPVLFSVFNAISAIGGLIALYAALVGLHWLPNVADRLH